MQLRDAVCVITGGAKGLGKYLVKELASRGAKIVIGDLDAQELERVAQEYTASALSCDVTEQKQVESLARRAIEQHGKIDLWINNAGIWMPYGPTDELDFKKCRTLMEVNFFGLAHGTVEAMRFMKPKSRGTIVNIISVRGLKGKALAASYSASKFAAEGFTQAVRDELREFGIHVIGVYPYRMKTELFGDNKHGDYDVSMEPSEVARIIVNHLAEEQPSEQIEIWGTEDVRKISWDTTNECIVNVTTKK